MQNMVLEWWNQRHVHAIVEDPESDLLAGVGNALLVDQTLQVLVNWIARLYQTLAHQSLTHFVAWKRLVVCKRPGYQVVCEQMLGDFGG